MKDNLTYGIITSCKYEDLNFEKKVLFDTAKKYFDDVFLIDPRKVYYKFIRGNELPKIIYGNIDITNLSALNIRSTRGREASIALLAHTLNLCGCILNDPVSRFSVGYASKLLSTLKRFQNKTGSNSFIAFEKNCAINLIDKIHRENLFPLVAKPIRGNKGNGIVLLKNKCDSSKYILDFFETRESDDIPILFQSYIRFIKEFRVLVLDKKAISIVLKIKPDNKITANAAQGGLFVKEENYAITEFVSKNIEEDGFYGVDIGVDENGEFHIIETNRAPMWETLDKTLKSNTAEIIIQDALNKIGKLMN